MPWKLPAALLNILWEDIYPRIVPLIWESIHGERISGRTTFAKPKTQPYLSAYSIPNLLTLPTGPPIPSSIKGRKIMLQCMQALEDLSTRTRHFAFSASFRAGFDLVWEYLNETTPGFPPIPIYFYKTVEPDPTTLADVATQRQKYWGYDFLLSNHGLFIAVPPDPFVLPQQYAINALVGTDTGLSGEYRNRREIYAKYAFRRVSEAPMVLPLGQPSEFPATPTLDYLSSLPSTATDEQVMYYRRAAVSTGSNFTAAWPPSRERSVDMLTLPAANWQLNSSTYAKVMQAHPRIVADIWRYWNDEIYRSWKYEKTHPGSPPGTIFLDRSGISWPDATLVQYLNLPQTRYNRPAPNLSYTLPNAGDHIHLFDCRSLYGDYIETWLPPAVDASGTGMKFEPRCGLHEVLITNQGVLLPELRKPPTENQLMDAWVQGHSALPIFTDTGKCHS